MKIDGLSASDFPGIDEAKFGEWKALKLKDIKGFRIVAYISLPIGFVLAEIAKSNALAWQKRWGVGWEVVAYIFVGIYTVIIGVYHDITSRRLKKLGKELKMSARLRAKKKGLPYSG